MSTSSKPSDDHPWKIAQQRAGRRPAPASHPWRKRFNPVPYDTETTEAMRRQIEFQRREGVLDAVTQGYSAVDGGYRREPVFYDDDAGNGP